MAATVFRPPARRRMKIPLFLISVILLSVLPSCRSVPPVPYASMSDELRTLVQRHPAAKKVLLEAVASAKPRPGFRLRYAASMKPSGPRSEVRMPLPEPLEVQLPVVTIVSGQLPWDQLILLVFELHNSQGKPEFERLYEEARRGTIPRDRFVDGIMKVEFGAALRVKRILPSLPMTAEEKASSLTYHRLLFCPDEYKHMAAYVRRVSPRRGQAEEYRETYDGLRGGKPARLSFLE